MGKLGGKIALVTGSGRGIGRAVALKFASEGAKVVVNDLDADISAAVEDEIKKTGGEAVSCAGSVTEKGFADRFIATATEAFGVPDIIVNNAGYTWDNMIHKMTDEQFDAMIDVHLRAPFRILRAIQPHWKMAFKSEEQDARRVCRKVVNISSVAGTGGNPGQANYSSAKAGVVGMTKTLAKEWGRLNVNVNCVAFGYIETRLTEASDVKQEVEIEGNKIGLGIPRSVADGFRAMIPMGRAGSVEEAAGAVYLLTIPESDYISGQVVLCSGGISF
ncbi:SDR family NAD(P)-dependent oxidoreductase [Emcibacter nanhaiensis]|uniref:SDR family oxidoreductase n=1 Tax=Emcibacter nanhaiensis TaxID=1505037 RepID=A0A501PGT9_9PROT|nr:SDR family oxidoreductase [Emcibacter nanhaiensis]TPD59298.1 SDR family oxidoreductase [Emcibacter nanhaiensis]